MTSGNDLLVIVKKYALLNALKHDGKADEKVVLSNLLGERSDLRPKARELLPVVSQIVAEVNQLSPSEQSQIIRESWPEQLTQPKKPEPEERTLPPLPNADRYAQIVTRFSPNPDFALHIGNARAIFLSHDYARLHKGKFILRFEDTDPRLKKSVLEFYDRIREDLRWLGCVWDEEYIQSDRLPIYYEHATKLFDLGAAYVCDCYPESFRAKVNQGIPCPCRIVSLDHQKERWRRMLDGGYAEGAAVVRIKTDLNHPNPAIRDWPALRIIDTVKYPHPRVGSQYRVWPLYNLACGIDDHLLGITHILRGKEHLTNTERQKFLFRHLGWTFPEAIHYGRLRLQGTSLSKSKMMRDLEEGKYDGLSDARLPTIAALRRRGIEAGALQKMIWEVGPRPVDSMVSWEILYSFNRKILDRTAPRYFFLQEPKPVRVTGLRAKEYAASMSLHPGVENSAKRTISITAFDGEAMIRLSEPDHGAARPGLQVRFMDLFNVSFTQAGAKDASAIYVSDSYEEARKGGMQLIQWLPEGYGIPGEIVMPDGSRVRGFFEENIRSELVGQVVQLVRFGFVRLDFMDAERVVAYFAHN